MNANTNEDQSVPTAHPVFYRSYSRRTDDGDREQWQQSIDRSLGGLVKVGNLSPIEVETLRLLGHQKKVMPSGRWLWVGGTVWVYCPANFAGAYNCSSTDVVDTAAFGLLMDLAMTGCGTGAVLESHCIDRLPPIRNTIAVTVTGNFGDQDPGNPDTIFTVGDDGDRVTIQIGDSRKGWVSAYQGLIELAMDDRLAPHVAVTVDISHVRPAGRPLKGFGGVANPAKLPDLFPRVAEITNGAIGRQLTAEECCLLIDEAAVVVVCGNIRRCLPEDALVHTANGLVPIKDVQVGDMVHTPIGLRRVTNKFDQGVQRVYRIEVSGPMPAPRATLNHRMAVADADEPTGYRWVEVRRLESGDCLLTPESELVGVIGVGGAIKAHTYDIEVEEAHCFYGDGFLTHNSAGMRQFNANGPLLKENLWVEIDGKWRIDPKRDALRAANHTRVYHTKPTESECIEAVSKQFQSGEGAIQYAPEAIARSSADLLNTDDLRRQFLAIYTEQGKDAAGAFLLSLSPEQSEREVSDRLRRYGLNPCGEITLHDNFCNLCEVHLNQMNPQNLQEQVAAFKAAALWAAPLLHHDLTEVDPRYQYSRSVDPIVGVSFTGLFDFFVKAFGVDWLHWWEAGRPDWWLGEQISPQMQVIAHQLGINPEDYSLPNRKQISGLYHEMAGLYRAIEAAYLKLWRDAATQSVWDYCDRNGLRRPNRCTTVQPSGSKSLLTGASPGWHPPKSARFIRRITFRKNDPIALAYIDYGYSVVPSQSDKDDQGNLLTDPFDPRCTEWLVEIPVAVDWADLPGADTIAIEDFSALAQFDFYMQVQRHYAAHNCFARNTQFLTSEGVRTFESFEVGDTVTVLNADGNWVPATVVNTGDERPMLAITIREGKTGKEKTITSTHCHRFPVRRASGGDSKVKILQAKDLKIGHRLVLNSADLPDLDEDGIRHGIVFGDGSLYKNSKGEYHKAQLYLCGGKRHLQSYFGSYGRNERDDIDQTRIYGLPMEWKSLPSDDRSQSYVAGFIAGLLATDGNISRSTASIATGRQSVVDYVLDQSPRIGIKVTGFQWFEASGFKQGSGAFQIRFSKATFPENMVLRPHHMEHFRAHESQPCQWRVVDIRDAAPQVGWCVMEPLTNHFTLTDNILVMNTSATIELRKGEIEELGRRIHQAIANDEGYISAALLARYDDHQTFPRLPFEQISRETYDRLVLEVLARRKSSDFHALLAKHDRGVVLDASEQGPAGCDSDKCLLPEVKGK